MIATIKTNAGKVNEEIFQIEMPNLEGSDKQIEAATCVFVDTVTGLCNMVSGKMGNDKVKAQYDMIIAKLSGQTSSKFWIENKGNNFQSIFKSI